MHYIYPFLVGTLLSILILLCYKFDWTQKFELVPDCGPGFFFLRDVPVDCTDCFVLNFFFLSPVSPLPWVLIALTT